jgi:ATP-dependent exoDNAse (exonuclease V) beta subunit
VAARVRAALPGSASQALEPQSYTRLAEREKRMSESELRRLLYVATTRAKDHLVLSCFGSPTTKDGSPSSGALFGPVAGSLPAPAELAEDYEDGGVLVLAPREAPVRQEVDDEPDAQAMIAEREAWELRRAEVLEAAGRPAPATSPSGLEHVDEEVRSGGPGAPAGRARALALGSAVHRIMELCDLGDVTSVGRVAGPVARELERPDLEHDAAALARDCWRARPVREAAAAQAADADAVHRELHLGALVEGVVLGGAVDLLYRDGGQWVVVDYKTDKAAEPDVLLERYRPQGAAYALAAEAVLGHGAVREVVFIAARADGLAVTVPVDEELRALARAEVRAAACGGRAVVADEPAG